MNATYEHKNELTFIGYHTEIAPNAAIKSVLSFGTRNMPKSMLASGRP